MLTRSIWSYIGVNADTLSFGSKKRVVHQGKTEKVQIIVCHKIENGLLQT